MRILIVDDSKNKNKWIREILKRENIQYDEITYMNEAYNRIVDNPNLYNGIILDMQFSLMSDTAIEGRMGEKLLRKLKHREINIPVLGNSTMEFPPVSEYPFLKGNTYGYYNPQILNDFLKNMKDG